MTYQRNEYADKTLSVNSMCDRQLKLKLDTIDSHKGSIEKELKRERLRIQKELVETECHLKTRLSANDLAPLSPEARKHSPRLARRFSTPQNLTVSLPSQRLDVRRSPVPIRRASDNTLDVTTSELRSPSPRSPSPVSPRQSSNQLLPGFPNQPRRKSLPPINPNASLTGVDNTESKGKKSPSSLTPLSLSRRSSYLGGSEEDLNSRVTKFLQKMEISTSNEAMRATQDCNDEESLPSALDHVDKNALELTKPLQPPSHKIATFMPANFE